MNARRPLIAGNWKMNLAPAEGADLARALVAGLTDREAAADLVLAPTALALPAVVAALGDADLAVAGQDMRAEEMGAYTGDISGPMLRSAGAGWVILGHSERRQYHAETDAGVALKAKAALAAGLLPILCVGESLEQREAGEMLTVVLTQVDGVLNGLSEDELSLVTLAYEPIWAIGTGVVATVEQAQEMHGAIRSHLTQSLGGELAGRIRILYGGSVKPDNVRDLLAEPDLDGALVGGASLTADSFLALIPPFQAS